MIISASYKTDIPTFYGDWFMSRLRAGHCKMINPYNRRPIHVSLARGDVDGFVFWTKNVGPFLKHLPAVREMGFPFYVQHTINGYPRALETSVVDASRAVGHAHAIRERFGPRAFVWRYDTVLFSSLTPADFHAENFARLASELRGTTDEAVVSFAHVYRKTERNLNEAARAAGFTWRDPSASEKCELLERLVGVARANGMQLTVCSQRDYLIPGAGDARCVDARRIEDVAGRAVDAERRGNRKECGCHASRDIGEYDTCPHGCTYCYAVQNRDLSLSRFREHDPSSEYLFGPPPGAREAEPVRAETGSADDGKRQLPLFPRS